MKSAPKFPLACLLASLFCAPLCAPLSAAMFRTVVLTGDVAPVGVLLPPAFDTLFLAHSINSSGDVAFYGYFTGTGIDSSNNEGYWSEDSEILSLVAREGNHAPGTPGGVNFFANPALSVRLVFNSVGQTAFRGQVDGTGVDLLSNGAGIWSEGSGSLALIARAGSQAPGTPIGVNFKGYVDVGSLVNRMGTPVLNSNGKVAFTSLLGGAGVDSTNDRGIWSEGSGPLTLIARTGNQAPGTPFGIKFSALSRPVLSDTTNEAVFRGTLVGSGVDGSNESGIWSGVGGIGGGAALVARGGDAAPGTAMGVNFSHFEAPLINGMGEIAFASSLSGPGVTSANDTGIWSEGSGSLSLVAREGNQPPGTPLDVSFADFSILRINGSGHTAFRASLTGGSVDSSNDPGIWSEASGSLELVMRMGDHAPGTDPGVNFGDMANTFPTLNGAGQVAFLGRLTGPGVGGSNDFGIWAQDASGILTSIVREGDLFDVSDDPGSPDLRTISQINFGGASGNGDGLSSVFNDLGQVVFYASFTDGSAGLFVTEVLAIPEPSSVLLVATAWTGLLRRRSR